MESDVDWDIRIHAAMLGLTDGVRAIADFPFADHQFKPYEGQVIDTPPQAPISPYGDNWDFLWLGHCGANGGEDPRYYAYHDPSAGERKRAWTFDAGPPNYYGPLVETRLVFQLRAITCSPAYAISLRGARKFQAYMEMANSPFDMEVKGRCLHEHDTVCLATFPQMFSVSPSQSNIGKDAAEPVNQTEVQQIQGGFGLQISARVNADLGLNLQDTAKWRKEYEVHH